MKDTELDPNGVYYFYCSQCGLSRWGPPNSVCSCVSPEGDSYTLWDRLNSEIGV